MKTFRVPMSLCLHCGYSSDTTTDITDHAAPKAGDLTICLNCGGLLRFEPDLMRSVASDEALAEVEPGAAAVVRRAWEFTRKRGRYDKPGKAT